MRRPRSPAHAGLPLPLYSPHSCCRPRCRSHCRSLEGDRPRPRPRPRRARRSLPSSPAEWRSARPAREGPEPVGTAAPHCHRPRLAARPPPRASRRSSRRHAAASCHAWRASQLKGCVRGSRRHRGALVYCSGVADGALRRRWRPSRQQAAALPPAVGTGWAALSSPAALARDLLWRTRPGPQSEPGPPGPARLGGAQTGIAQLRPTSTRGDSEQLSSRRTRCLEALSESQAATRLYSPRPPGRATGFLTPNRG